MTPNTPFPVDILLASLAAVLVVVRAAGPDSILAIGRGLSQGRVAAALSSVDAGLGIMVHGIAATLGLALLLQTSPVAFWVVKLAGVTALVVSVLGACAARLSQWLSRRPHVAVAANVGAGLTSVAAGLSIMASERRT